MLSHVVERMISRTGGSKADLHLIDFYFPAHLGHRVTLLFTLYFQGKNKKTKTKNKNRLINMFEFIKVLE